MLLRVRLLVVILPAYMRILEQLSHCRKRINRVRIADVSRFSVIRIVDQSTALCRYCIEMVRLAWACPGGKRRRGPNKPAGVLPIIGYLVPIVIRQGIKHPGWSRTSRRMVRMLGRQLAGRYCFVLAVLIL